MRFFLGMIAGALILGLSTYMYDTRAGMGAADGARPMVNWDVVDRNWSDLRTGVTAMTTKLRDEWNKRAG